MNTNDSNKSGDPSGARLIEQLQRAVMHDNHCAQFGYRGTEAEQCDGCDVVREAAAQLTTLQAAHDELKKTLRDGRALLSATVPATASENQPCAKCSAWCADNCIGLTADRCGCPCHGWKACRGRARIGAGYVACVLAFEHEGVCRG